MNRRSKLADDRVWLGRERLLACRRQRRRRIQKKLEAVRLDAEKIKEVAMRRDRELSPDKKRNATEWCRYNGFELIKIARKADAFYALVANESDHRLLIYPHEGRVQIMSEDVEKRFQEAKNFVSDFEYFLALSCDAPQASVRLRRKKIAQAALRIFGNFSIEEANPTAYVIDAVKRGDFGGVGTEGYAAQIWTSLKLALEVYDDFAKRGVDNKFAESRIDIKRVRKKYFEHIHVLKERGEISVATGYYPPYPPKLIPKLFEAAASQDVKVLNFIAYATSLGLRPSSADQIKPEHFENGWIHSELVAYKIRKTLALTDEDCRRHNLKNAAKADGSSYIPGEKASVLAFVLATEDRLKGAGRRRVNKDALRSVFSDFHWRGSRSTFLTNEGYCSDFRYKDSMESSSAIYRYRLRLIDESTNEVFVVNEWDSFFQSFLLDCYLTAVRGISEELFARAKKRAIDFLRERMEERRSSDDIATTRM
jgi:hypothetical protein